MPLMITNPTQHPLCDLSVTIKSPRLRPSPRLLVKRPCDTTFPDLDPGVSSSQCLFLSLTQSIESSASILNFTIFLAFRQGLFLGGLFTLWPSAREIILDYLSSLLLWMDISDPWAPGVRVSDLKDYLHATDKTTFTNCSRMKKSDLQAMVWKRKNGDDCPLPPHAIASDHNSAKATQNPPASSSTIDRNTSATAKSVQPDKTSTGASARVRFTRDTRDPGSSSSRQRQPAPPIASTSKVQTGDSSSRGKRKGSPNENLQRNSESSLSSLSDHSSDFSFGEDTFHFPGEDASSKKKKPRRGPGPDKSAVKQKKVDPVLPPQAPRLPRAMSRDPQLALPRKDKLPPPTAPVTAPASQFSQFSIIDPQRMPPSPKESPLENEPRPLIPYRALVPDAPTPPAIAPSADLIVLTQFDGFEWPAEEVRPPTAAVVLARDPQMTSLKEPLQPLLSEPHLPPTPLPHPPSSFLLNESNIPSLNDVPPRVLQVPGGIEQNKNCPDNQQTCANESLHAKLTTVLPTCSIQELQKTHTMPYNNSVAGSDQRVAALASEPVLDYKHNLDRPMTLAAGQASGAQKPTSSSDPMVIGDNKSVVSDIHHSRVAQSGSNQQLHTTPTSPVNHSLAGSDQPVATLASEPVLDCKHNRDRPITLAANHASGPQKPTFIPIVSSSPSAAPTTTSRSAAPITKDISPELRHGFFADLVQDFHKTMKTTPQSGHPSSCMSHSDCAMKIASLENRVSALEQMMVRSAFTIPGPIAPVRQPSHPSASSPFRGTTAAASNPIAPGHQLSHPYASSPLRGTTAAATNVSAQLSSHFTKSVPVTATYNSDGARAKPPNHWFVMSKPPVPNVQPVSQVTQRYPTPNATVLPESRGAAMRYHQPSFAISSEGSSSAARQGHQAPAPTFTSRATAAAATSVSAEFSSRFTQSVPSTATHNNDTRAQAKHPNNLFVMGKLPVANDQHVSQSTQRYPTPSATVLPKGSGAATQDHQAPCAISLEGFLGAARQGHQAPGLTFTSLATPVFGRRKARPLPVAKKILTPSPHPKQPAVPTDLTPTQTVNALELSKSTPPPSVQTTSPTATQIPSDSTPTQTVTALQLSKSKPTPSVQTTVTPSPTHNELRTPNSAPSTPNSARGLVEVTRIPNPVQKPTTPQHESDPPTPESRQILHSSNDSSSRSAASSNLTPLKPREERPASKAQQLLHPPKTLPSHATGPHNLPSPQRQEPSPPNDPCNPSRGDQIESERPSHRIHSPVACAKSSGSLQQVTENAIALTSPASNRTPPTAPSLTRAADPSMTSTATLPKELNAPASSNLPNAQQSQPSAIHPSLEEPPDATDHLCPIIETERPPVCQTSQPTQVACEPSPERPEPLKLEDALHVAMAESDFGHQN